MAVKQPILIGGLGLSVTLGLLHTMHISVIDSSTLLSAIVLGSGLWWWRRHDRPPAGPRPVAPPVVDHQRLATELSQLQQLIQTLETETLTLTSGLTSGLACGLIDPTLPSTYRQQCQAIEADLDRRQLRLAVVGDRHGGKTTLVAALISHPDLAQAHLTFEEVSCTRAGLSPPTPSPDILDYDGILLITPTDLTQSTQSWLEQRLLSGQAAVLVFSKIDHHTPGDRQTLLTQLEHRSAQLPAPVPVVPVAVNPRPTRVRRHQADGTLVEQLEPTAPILDPLPRVMEQTLAAQPLVLATNLRRTQALREQIQTALHQVRRQVALPQIEQLQWVAGATAFASPVASLDLLASLAINGQLIINLGQIYGFNLSLQQARVAASTLASLTMQLGLVELSTQALSAVLKSHFATYVAGGMVQGLGAAYLTRMAGLSLIDYFEQAALAGTPTAALSWEAIAQHLQEVILQNRQVSLLQTLITQALPRFGSSPTQVALPSQGIETTASLPLEAQPSPIDG
ncbi:MAG: YcjF family protein [Cyanobacteria bacterium REEB459]|nr:YcjF family protein [Cyanobacteria bacterium REEB459]